MSTNGQAGFDGVLYVDVSATPTKIADIREVSISIEGRRIDTTTHDDAWDVSIAGRKGYTLSAEYLYIADDAAQEELIDKIFDQSSIDFELRPVDGSGRVISGTVGVTSWELAMPNDDADLISIEMQGIGAPVDGTQ